MNNEEPLISVIIPAYNAEATLADAINSVLSQSLHNLELIVVNDGSVDKTGQIIDEFKKKDSDRFIGIHCSNAGVSAARNMGLDIARGKYIGFVDADDTISPMMYEEMILYAEEKNAELVQCWRYDVFEGEKVIRKNKKDCSGKNIYEKPEIVMNNTLFVWDKIYRRDVIELNKIRFKPYRYAEDYLFLFQYEMVANGIEELKSPFYYYKAKRKGAVTSSYSDSLLDAAKVFDYLNRMLVERGEFQIFERYLWNVEAFYYIRRIDDFLLYSNMEFQEKIAKSYFDLFDKYFYDWKNTITKTGTRYGFERRFNAYRSDWRKMLQYIHSSKLQIEIKRKIIGFIVHILEKKDDLKSRVKKKIPLMKYARYRKMPIENNAVVLTSYYGSSFSDSIYYMAEDLLNRRKFKVYIGTNSIKRDWKFIGFNKLEPELIDVKSTDYLKVLATAKYLVCNSRFPAWFSKRPEQILLNTWHGTPLKKLGKDMNHGIKDLGNNQSQFLMCDYLLYPNEYTRDCIMKSFFLDDIYCGKVVLCGYPRNSIFFDKEDAQKVRYRLGLNDKKVYMYMPTWRGETIDTATVSAYSSELNSILSELDKLLDDSVVVFVKLHQVVMRKIELDRYKHFRPPHPLYENYRFANMTDGLITDYSSVFFDYANSGKEIILFTYDYEKYMKERGTYFDMSILPFTRINTVSSLAEHLNSNITFIPDDDYNNLCKKYCLYDSAQSAKYLNDIMLGETKSEKIRVEDYSVNAEKKYRVHFMSALCTEDEQKEFDNLVLNSDAKDLFVFSQQEFCYSTERMLVKYANYGFRYVVIPSDMPETFWGFLILCFYRKFSVFRKIAKHLYLKDMNRVLPNISIYEFYNYSNIPKFKEICKLCNVK